MKKTALLLVSILLVTIALSSQVLRKKAPSLEIIDIETSLLMDGWSYRNWGFYLTIKNTGRTANNVVITYKHLETKIGTIKSDEIVYDIWIPSGYTYSRKGLYAATFIFEWDGGSMNITRNFRIG